MDISSDSSVEARERRKEAILSGSSFESSASEGSLLDISKEKYSRHGRDGMTARLGRKLEAVKAQQERVELASKDVDEEWKQWDSLLSKEFVKYARETKFIQVICSSECTEFI